MTKQISRARGARFLTIGLLAGACILAATSSVFAQAANPVDVLKSGADFAAKADACRQLCQRGGSDAVPALAALLGDEKLSHMARYALEPMPFPEAGAALREALGKYNGAIKVGIINSLGIRKDEQAVPELAKLLADADASVAQSAAISLGMIATAEGAKALQDALNLAPEANGSSRRAFADGLLGCAERFAKRGEREPAAAVYEFLLNAAALPEQIYPAALRGAILTHDKGWALPKLTEALAGQSKKAYLAALRAARELGKDDAVTAALVGALPALPADRKVQVMDVLAQRGDSAAGPALLLEAKDGPVEVRIAAIRSVTRLGYAPALELIGQLAAGSDEALAAAARSSLSYFPSQNREADIKAMLANADPAIRSVAVELVGGRAIDNSVAVLLNIAQTDADETVRLAALKALKDSAGLAEMPAMLDGLLKEGHSAAETQAFEAVLSALCERQKRAPSNLVITKAVYGALPDGPSADVTAKVAQLVADGKFAIPASNGAFGDTAPGRVKMLQVEYTEGGKPVTKTAAESQTLKLTVVTAPAEITDAFCAANEKAQGEAKLATIRLLGSTASVKALDAVKAAASGSDATAKDAALRVLFAWPTPDALAAVMDIAKTATDDTLRVLALRGAVRLLGISTAPEAELLGNYTALLENARTPDEKKTVLGGFAQLPTTQALELVLAQFGDESVKAEAVQAAIGIARGLGKSAAERKDFFNGTDLTGWQSSENLWSVEEGAIVGQATEAPKVNEFIWSNLEAGDFYLSVDIKLEPNTGNAGVQFRSKKINEHGQALGYQADVGQDVWGRLYHEHGRGKLDWNDRGEQAVKPGEWNHYEILAIGPAIWTAINGKLSVACIDPDGKDERTGLFGLQLHAGIVETARYRITKLVLNPKIELEGIPTETLISELKILQKP